MEALHSLTCIVSSILKTILDVYVNPPCLWLCIKHPILFITLWILHGDLDYFGTLVHTRVVWGKSEHQSNSCKQYPLPISVTIRVV